MNVPNSHCCCFVFLYIINIFVVENDYINWHKCSFPLPVKRQDYCGLLPHWSVWRYESGMWGHHLVYFNQQWRWWHVCAHTDSLCVEKGTGCWGLGDTGVWCFDDVLFLRPATVVVSPRKLFKDLSNVQYRDWRCLFLDLTSTLSLNCSLRKWKAGTALMCFVVFPALYIECTLYMCFKVKQ